MSKLDLAKQWQAHADRWKQRAIESKTNEEYRRCIREALSIERKIHELIHGQEPV